MVKLSSDAVEVVNRNALVTVALKQGYNAYLPVYDHGIDLILHRKGTADTKLIQLKGRWTIDKKYLGLNIWIAFPDRGNWYLVPHDDLVKLGGRHLGSESWAKGTYSKSPLSKTDLADLKPYLFGDADAVFDEAEAAIKAK